MIDIHAHFAEEGYEFPAEWEKIKAAGVDKVVLAADTLAHAAMHWEFAEEHDGCYFTVGVHPSEADDFLETGAIDRFRALCAGEKCIGVGEIGLDYHDPDAQKEKQRRVFEMQLIEAAALDLPVQIHSRDACSDTLAILKEYESCLKHGFLLHCYSYGREEAERFLAMGAYFSFGGVTCFKNARRVTESVSFCPLDRILSETDSPYLSPFRGEKNTPANIPVIVERIASIKGISKEEAEAAIAENAVRLFPKLR